MDYRTQRCWGEDDKIIYFIVNKQHSLKKGFKIAPFASSLLDDMDVAVLRETDRGSSTKASLVAFQGGENVKLQCVEYIKAKELLLQAEDKAGICLEGDIKSSCKS